MSDILAVIDFDGGGAGTKSAFYPDNDNIRCWDPWVMQKGDRTAYDYPATHDRVMSIMQFLVNEHETLWGVHITGIDLWDNVCQNNMRITDLGLAKDGIGQQTTEAQVRALGFRTSGTGRLEPRDSIN